MDFEKALGFAVISSWEDLVKPDDNASIHVEYANVDGFPVAWLQVWAMHKGNGNRVCTYSTLPSSGSESQGIQFATSYASETLSEALEFIMGNQSQFGRPKGHSVSGLVQVALPGAEDRANADEWWHTILTELVRQAPPSYAQPTMRLGAFANLKNQTN